MCTRMHMYFAVTSISSHSNTCMYNILLQWAYMYMYNMHPSLFPAPSPPLFLPPSLSLPLPPSPHLSMTIGLAAVGCDTVSTIFFFVFVLSLKQSLSSGTELYPPFPSSSKISTATSKSHVNSLEVKGERGWLAG